MSPDDYLSRLTIDYSVLGQSMGIDDVHNDLEVEMEDGITTLSCCNCDCKWTMSLAYSDDLDDHFTLEQVSGGDPLICEGEEEDEEEEDEYGEKDDN
jgi:hypothetical protein